VSKPGSSDPVFRRTAEQLEACAEQAGRPGSVERQLLDVALRCVNAAWFLVASGSVAGVRRRTDGQGVRRSVELELLVARASKLMGEAVGIWSAVGPTDTQVAELAPMLRSLADDVRVRAAAARDDLESELLELEKLRTQVAELGARAEASECDGRRLGEEVAALERRRDEMSRRIARLADDRVRILEQIEQLDRLRLECGERGATVSQMEVKLGECRARVGELARKENELKETHAAEARDLEQVESRVAATKTLIEQLRSDPRAEIRAAVRKVWEALPADQLDRLLRQTPGPQRTSTPESQAGG
jgi:predicted  nucleic acid-binding Zn-ribbon protein